MPVFSFDFFLDFFAISGWWAWGVYLLLLYSKCYDYWKCTYDLNNIVAKMLMLYVQFVCLPMYLSVRPSVRLAALVVLSIHLYIHIFQQRSFLYLYYMPQFLKCIIIVFFSYNSASIFRRGNVTKWYVWATMPAIALLLSF